LWLNQVKEDLKSLSSVAAHAIGCWFPFNCFGIQKMVSNLYLYKNSNQFWRTLCTIYNFSLYIFLATKFLISSTSKVLYMMPSAALKGHVELANRLINCKLVLSSWHMATSLILRTVISCCSVLAPPHLGMYPCVTSTRCRSQHGSPVM